MEINEDAQDEDELADDPTITDQGDRSASELDVQAQASVQRGRQTNPVVAPNKAKPAKSAPVVSPASIPPGSGHVQGVDDFDVPFHEREALKSRGDGFPPPPSRHQYFHQSASMKPPKHIHSPQIVSTRLPHNAWRQLGAARDGLLERCPNPETIKAMNERIDQALRTDASTMERIMRDFAEERHSLRQALLKLLWWIRDIEFQSEVACMILSDSEAGLKDVYVVRCVKVLCTFIPDISEEEAMTEVVRMATDDQLFETDLFTIGEDDNTLRLDLSTTFPHSVRLQMDRDEQVAFIIYGALGEREDCDNTMRLLRHIMPVRGMGRTQAESNARGLLGIEHQKVRRELERGGTYGVHGLLVDPNVPVGKPGHETPARRYEDDLILPRDKLWHTVGPSIVRYTEKSPFSMGEFFGDNPDGETWTGNAWGRLCMEEREKRREEYGRAWTQSCERELEIYRKLRDEGLDLEPRSSQVGMATAAQIPLRPSSQSLGAPASPDDRTRETSKNQGGAGGLESGLASASLFGPQGHSTPRRTENAPAVLRGSQSPYAGDPDESDDDEGAGDESRDM
ncbi:hypothetical protein FRC12_014357 [Ceratobasidium sp. 428]|nr:hypothetical protein FRC12_014357 [Ceratobasidium sp. 428]